MALQKEISQILLIINLFVLFIATILSIALSYISLIFPIYISLLTLAWVIRYTSYNVLFPGSNKYISRLFRTSSHLEFNKDYLKKLKSLESFLISLGKPVLSLSPGSLQKSRKIIKNNPRYLSSTHKESQKNLIDLFQTLQKSLKKTIVLYQGDLRITAWSALKYADKIDKNSKTEVLGDIMKPLNILKNILSYFQTSEISIVNIFWFSEPVIGGFDYTRTELLFSYNCEREFIKQEDGTEIDSILIKNDSDKIVIYCQPNAGYYEYLLYHSNWIEFYSELNISLLAFNYRGYGNSKGSPALPVLAKDCAFLIDYVKAKGFSKVILHGESIGGAVACLAASMKEVDMLIADRTFSSVRQVYSQYIGVPFSYVMTFLGPSNSNISLSFSSVNTRKVLTYDPFDEVINIKSSLVSGLSSSNPSLLNFKTFQSGIECLKRFKFRLNKVTEVDPEIAEQSTDKLKHLKLTFIQSNTLLKELIFKFFLICDKINSAGFKMLDLVETNKDCSEIWVKNLQVWGSHNTKTGIQSEISTIEYLRNCISDIRRLRGEYFCMDKEIKKMLKAFKCIEISLKEVLARMEEKFIYEEKDSRLIVLGCGHSGYFKAQEETLLSQYIAELLD